MISIIDRLMSMGTTLGKQAAEELRDADAQIKKMGTLYAELGDRCAEWKAGCEAATGGLNALTAKHDELAARYAMAQEQIASLSNEVAACQEQIETMAALTGQDSHQNEPVVTTT